jgi:NAD-dependent dihydropyrimidine dehydrogenase PreA subunit
MWKLNESECIGCSACVNACPVGILEMVDRKGEQKSSIGDKQKDCTKCMTCVNVCPVNAIKVE